MIRGVQIEIGGREFTLPALNIEQLETYEEDIKKVSEAAVKGVEAFAKERFAAMARVIHAALTRNYPELAIEEVRNLLDLRSVGPAFQAVMGVSGLDQKEAPSPVGEAKAEAPTGGASAPASAAAPAGAGPTPAS